MHPNTASRSCPANNSPFVINAPMNGEIFLTYLEQCLVLTLSPGEIRAIG